MILSLKHTSWSIWFFQYNSQSIWCRIVGDY